MNMTCCCTLNTVVLTVYDTLSPDVVNSAIPVAFDCVGGTSSWPDSLALNLLVFCANTAEFSLVYTTIPVAKMIAIVKTNAVLNFIIIISYCLTKYISYLLKIKKKP